MAYDVIRLFESLHLAENRLLRAGVDSPRLSAELILAMIKGVDRLWVLTHQDTVLTPEQSQSYFQAVELRAAGCPVAYLTGMREFFGRNFHVNSDVLIPRPETEILIETAQSLWTSGSDLVFADAGTGCGAVGVCFASLFPRSRGVLTDRSLPALRIAQKNVAAHELSFRLMCTCSDLVSVCRQQSLDVVLSNPPYIGSAEYWMLSKEIRHFEPRLALWGGLTGIDVSLRLIGQAFQVLRPGGWLCMEIGHDQFSVLRDQIQARSANHWDEVEVVQDLAGRDRVLKAKRV